MSATNAPTQFSNLLSALFSSCAGLIELRALPSGAQTFVSLADHQGVAAFLKTWGHENLYFGVASRRDATSGRLDNCYHLRALFVDIDFKATPEAEARRQLAHAPLPPSAIVHSGGGLHVYWFLREAILLPDEAAAARGLLRRLASGLGGDPRAAEPARILRVPGTVNYKPDYPTPPVVTLEICDASRAYNPDDLDSWLPAEPVPGPHTPSRMPGPVLEGTRNNTLYRLARSLRRKMTAPAVLAAVKAENAENCYPPLPSAEVGTIVRNALSQADAPGFDESAQPNRVPARVHDAAPVPSLPVPILRQQAFYGLAGQIVGLHSAVLGS
jgi:primase-like protein/DNA primase RepB-like protein